MKKKNKTAREWFETLEDPVGSKAIENAIKFGGKYLIDDEYDSLRSALMGTFIFDDTPEGGDYWYDLVEKLPK